tara:strand:- start:1983 stop:2678 length:696 start_codon:yes stop_codon:yes gene_type:complete
MKQRAIHFGVGSISNTGKPFPKNPEDLDDEFVKKIHERDDNSCQFCGFKSAKYQKVQFLGDNAERPDDADYVTACTYCHQCFHLDEIPRMQSGALIWLPEIDQAALNNIARAIYIARITQGPMADTARDALEFLMARKDEAKRRLGTDEPRILASIFQDFMEGREYARRNRRLGGFRIMPLDRRLVREGELEFNQFPQMLAYWRSSNGPYGGTPPRQWTELFYSVKDKLSA